MKKATTSETSLDKNSPTSAEPNTVPSKKESKTPTTIPSTEMTYVNENSPTPAEPNATTKASKKKSNIIKTKSGTEMANVTKNSLTPGPTPKVSTDIIKKSKSSLPKMIKSSTERPSMRADAISNTSGIIQKPSQVKSHQKPSQAITTGNNTCWQVIGSIWTTRTIAESQASNNREVEVLVMLRELILYLMFLIFLLIISVGMQGSTMFTHRKALANYFLETRFQSGERKLTFTKVTHMADFWAYTENVLIDGLFWDYWYERDQSKAIDVTSDDDKKILYENKLLGLARIRQLRVRPQSCVVHDDFRRSFSKCWAFYSDRAEDKETFGNGTSGLPWTYSSAEDLGGSTHTGLLATYGGGGYYQDLSLDYKKAKDQISELKKNLWITPATRAIFIDFTVYNANINLFCVCKLVMEFPPTGGVVPSWSIRSARLLRYVTPFDYFVLACEMVLFGFVIFYTFEEVNEIYYFRSKYFNHFWNLLDTTILCISYACIGLSIMRNFKIETQLKSLLEDEQHFEDFSSIGFWNMQYLNAVAVCVFISWIKIFKYISFNKTMSQLSNTLSRCAGDIGGFAVMFFIVFCAFAQLGYLIFGTQVAGFSSWTRSVITLLRTILGDFDYEAIENANRILGPIFFLLYIFFVFFVLLNMFLAIINDTYAEVKSEIASKPAEIEVLSRGWHNLIFKLGCGKSQQWRENEVMSVDYLRNMLKKCNFTDNEIDSFFKKYGIDQSMIGARETKLMLEDYNKTNGRLARALKLPGEQPEESFSYDISVLEDRCRKMEYIVGKLNDRLEGIIATLEQRKNLEIKINEELDDDDKLV